MNNKDIIELIKQGESAVVEFKETFDKDTIETVGAFANTQGGSVLIGVSDKGKIKGLTVGKTTLRDWPNQISQSTEPRLIPEIEHLRIEEKEIVAIQIKEYPIKPISVKGKCYRRVGNANRVMMPQEITQMHLSSMGTSLDAFPIIDATLDDIDHTQVARYIKKANASGRRKIENESKPMQVLEKIELVKNKKPTRAAILLFGKEPQQKFSQATVHCGRFKKETEIIDDRLIGGSIIEQVEEVMDFVRKNTNVRFVITGKPQREQIWDYPLEAIKEAVTNAICHRDYADNSDIQLKIHDNRFTIWNPGGLPFGMTIDDLYNPDHNSKPRNKLIAGIFYDVELIERYGSGIQRIMDACKKADLPSPTFEEKFGGFLVIFRKDVYTEEYLRSLGLNERQIKAVMFAKEKGKITNKEYRELTKISRQMATIDLTNLVNKYVLKKVGRAGKGIAYQLTKLTNN